MNAILFPRFGTLDGHWPTPLSYPTKHFCNKRVRLVSNMCLLFTSLCRKAVLRYRLCVTSQSSVKAPNPEFSNTQEPKSSFRNSTITGPGSHTRTGSSTSPPTRSALKIISFTSRVSSITWKQSQEHFMKGAIQNRWEKEYEGRQETFNERQQRLRTTYHLSPALNSMGRSPNF